MVKMLTAKEAVETYFYSGATVTFGGFANGLMHPEAINLTRYIGPQMEDKGSGAIVNISSVVGEYGNIGQANYAAAKAGVIGLTKTWAKEFARKGAAVRVNCIAPGYTMTDMLKTVPQDLLDKFADMTMLKRLGRPEEIASAALFLVSEEASYVTGQVLSVNGGMRL